MYRTKQENKCYLMYKAPLFRIPSFKDKISQYGKLNNEKTGSYMYVQRKVGAMYTKFHYWFYLGENIYRDSNNKDNNLSSIFDMYIM